MLFLDLHGGGMVRSLWGKSLTIPDAWAAGRQILICVTWAWALAFFHAFPNCSKEQPGARTTGSVLPLTPQLALYFSSLHASRLKKTSLNRAFLAPTPGVGFRPLSWDPFGFELTSHCDQLSQEKTQGLSRTQASSAATRSLWLLCIVGPGMVRLIHLTPLSSWQTRSGRGTLTGLGSRLWELLETADITYAPSWTTYPTLALTLNPTAHPGPCFTFNIIHTFSSPQSLVQGVM